jgi:hypothetical protein
MFRERRWFTESFFVEAQEHEEVRRKLWSYREGIS